MNKSDYTKLLESHDIKPTSNRILVARALAHKRHPVSLRELEDDLQTIDKSGIFRSLVLFHDHHLVHAIEGGDGTMLYELCHSQHTAMDEDDDDQHVHFYCQRCRRTICLHDTPVPDIRLPEGFRCRSMNFTLKGLCPDCVRKAEVHLT